MDGNFDCSRCRRKAECCCLCGDNLRVYLCSVCQPCHTKDGNIHTIAPVSVPPTVTRATLPQYAEKLEAAKKYLSSIKGVKSRLKEEKLSVQNSVSKRYDEKSKELLKMYKDLEATVLAIYDRLISEVKTMKLEIKWWLRDQRGLSQECLAMIRSGCHYSADREVLSPLCFDLGPLQFTAAQVPQHEHIATILEKGSYGCNCDECVATAVKMLADTVWQCECCGDVPNTEQVCRTCSARKPQCERRTLTNLNRLETHTTATPSGDDRSSQQPAGQIFSCPVCNSPFVPSVGCKNCQNDAAQDSPPTHRCSDCGTAVAEGTSKCQTCASQTPGPLPTPQPEETKSAKWMCWECGAYTDSNFDVCKKCKTSKHFHCFLIKHYMSVTANKESWICKCKHLNPLMYEVCMMCGRINVLVKNGKLGQGNKVGPFTPNLKR